MGPFAKTCACKRKKKTLYALISSNRVSIYQVTGTVSQKRNIMSAQLGLDGDSIHFGGNTNSNVQYNVVYRCWNNYGSTGPWTGVASIGTAVNAFGLATTEAAAISYYP